MFLTSTNRTARWAKNKDLNIYVGIYFYRTTKLFLRRRECWDVLQIKKKIYPIVSDVLVIIDFKRLES